MRISRRIASSTPPATTAMHGRVDKLKLKGELTDEVPNTLPPARLGMQMNQDNR